MPNPEQVTLMNVLSLTVASATVLTAGGIFYNPQIKAESNLRKARRSLENLSNTGYAISREYFVKTGAKGGVQKFYRIKKRALQVIEKTDWKFHAINPGNIEHDYMTAVYLIHLFRCCVIRRMELRWYPPFGVGNKKSDGGIAVYKNGEIRDFIMIESDRATHNHREIRDKFEAYCQFLAGNEKRKLVFLVSGIKRAGNLQETLKNTIKEQESFLHRIRFICPLNLSPDADIFADSIRCPGFEIRPDKSPGRCPGTVSDHSLIPDTMPGQDCPQSFPLRSATY